MDKKPNTNNPYSPAADQEKTHLEEFYLSFESDDESITPPEVLSERLGFAIDEPRALRGTEIRELMEKAAAEMKIGESDEKRTLPPMIGERAVGMREISKGDGKKPSMKKVGERASEISKISKGDGKKIPHKMMKSNEDAVATMKMGEGDDKMVPTSSTMQGNVEVDFALQSSSNKPQKVSEKVEKKLNEEPSRVEKIAQTN